MKTSEAKHRFVHIWGTVGVEWGINKTMAQIHGFLLAADRAYSTEELMEDLKISRGNANMNLRELVNWGLVFRESRPGERKEYFVAEKDVWEVAQKIVRERRKRELDPMMKLLQQLHDETRPAGSHDKETQAFIKLLSDILTLGRRSASMLDLVLKLDQSKFFKPFMALMKR